MSRLALLVWLAAGSAFCADAGLMRTLKAVEDRYNRAQTLQIAFSEGYSAQGRTRKPESGTLFLRKPGRMRWQYSAPAGKLFLSDGKFVYLNFEGSIYAIPLRPGQALPPIPASGFRNKEDVAALPGARLILEPYAFVGPNPSVYAFTRFAIHRNIYRVPVP